MTLFLDSRYADGTIVTIYDSRKAKQNYNKSVYRTWPTYSVDYFLYKWVENDRLDNLASKYLGNTELWWQILDINPEISNPLTIKPGTEIKIPNA